MLLVNGSGRLVYGYRIGFSSPLSGMTKQSHLLTFGCDTAPLFIGTAALSFVSTLHSALVMIVLVLGLMLVRENNGLKYAIC